MGMVAESRIEGGAQLFAAPPHIGQQVFGVDDLLHRQGAGAGGGVAIYV